MVAGVLTAVFVGVTLNVRERVRGAVADKLEAGQRMLSALEERRARELSVQVATLAENPTLKAAVDTYQSELRTANAAFRREMLATIERELEKLAARISPTSSRSPIPSGAVLAVAGRRAADWPMQTRVCERDTSGTGAAYVTMPTGVFQFASVAARRCRRRRSATLQLGQARSTSATRTSCRRCRARDTLIVSDDRVDRVARCRSRSARRSRRPCSRALPAIDDRRRSAASEYAVKLLFQDGERRSTRSTRSTPRRACRCRTRCARWCVIALGAVRARGIRERVAGAHDLAADRHAVARRCRR